MCKGRTAAGHRLHLTEEIEWDEEKGNALN